LRLGSDWILNLSKISPVKKANVLRVGLHLPSFNLHGHYRNSIDDVIEYLKGNHINYKLFYFKDFYKPSFFDASYEYLKSCSVEHTYTDYESPDQLVRHISCLDILISNKLHCCIVGCSQGVKVLSVGVHEKTRRFFDQINYSENNRLTSENYDGFVSSQLPFLKVPEIPEDVSQSLVDMRDDLRKFVTL